MEKDRQKQQKYSHNIRKYKVKNMKKEMNMTGKLSNFSDKTSPKYKMESGYSPAISTDDFKKNFTLKVTNKELVKQYGSIDFN